MVIAPTLGRLRRSRGFTLIELLLVLSVTLLVGAMGLSAYRTYTVRAEIAASLGLATGIQDSVATAFRRAGVPPTDRLSAGLPADPGVAPATNVDSIDIANGRIEIRFSSGADAAIAGRTLSLTPFETADQEIVWVCGNKIPNVGLEPLGFAGGAHQAIQVLTTIESRYLPSTCR
jgi:prepilin-type N-terminal cleavage/methylation domain-containing protein